MKILFKKIVLYILTLEARLILKKHKPFIIGVTGNIGKTSTKDLIFEVLKNLENKPLTIKDCESNQNKDLILTKIRKTEKSLNSEYGVPLTIIGQKSGWNNIFKWIRILSVGIGVYFQKSFPQIFVLEIGADREGDISSIIKWLKVDICIITQFAEYPVHVENFNNDRNLLIREKRYLLEGVKRGGKIIFNASCLDSAKMIQDAISENTIAKDIEIISFGKNIGDYEVHNIINSLENQNVTAQIHHNNGDNNTETLNITCNNTWGDAAIWTSLPAVIIGKMFNIENNLIIQSINDSQRSPGRMNILPSIWGQTVIDDSYNASPLAVQNGLEVLGELKNQNKNLRTIAILADMMELGEYAVKAHRSIGESVVNNKIDILVVVGARSKHTKDRARELGMRENHIFEYDNNKKLLSDIPLYCSDGTFNSPRQKTLIYIKGSQSMRMERVVAVILDKNLDKKSHLARQEDEWKRR